jgi:tetratricopeptide (TPR) repeat protein
LLLPLTEPQAAIEQLDRAISLAPDLAAAYLERAGRWTDRNLATQRAGLQPAASPFFLPALDDYTMATELRPELWEAFNDRSNFFYLTLQYALAAADGLRATELDPDEPRSWIRAGWGLYGLRRFDEAEEDFLRALQLDPEQEEAHFGLARVYRERVPSDNAKSVAAYRNACAIPSTKRAGLRLSPDRAVHAQTRVLTHSGQRHRSRRKSQA